MSIFFQISLALASSIITSFWAIGTTNGVKNQVAYWYLDMDAPSSSTTDIYDMNLISQILINWGRWFLIIMNFVSISLLVSLEMVKFTQGIFMEKDYLMYDAEKDMNMKV